MMPDVFDGNPIPLNRPGDFDIQKWLKGEMHPKGRSNLPPNGKSLPNSGQSDVSVSTNVALPAAGWDPKI